MKIIKNITIYFIIICWLMICGCASKMSYRTPIKSSNEGLYNKVRIEESRMMIKKGSLTIDVKDVRQTLKETDDIVKESGGYIENSRLNKDKSATLTLRIPSEKLESTIDKLTSLGKETNRYITSEDVTDTVMDLEAKLKNKKVLRDRLRELLDKAKDVKDVIAIEEQLTRLQSEIDCIEGQLKNMKGKIELSYLELKIRKKIVLGPLGYVTKGVIWVITKLFVISGEIDIGY